MPLPNLLENLPPSLSQEQVNSLCAGRQFRLERIVSTGQTTPPGKWYDQAEDEWLLLLAGEAELEFKDHERIRLQAGDQLQIVAHRRHRVSYTSATEHTVWLALYFTAAEMPELG